MGLVTASNEPSLVGAMTSEGTDVIEMSASSSGSTTGATVVVVGDGALVVLGDTVDAVGRVVPASVRAGGASVEIGALDVVGATAVDAGFDEHEAATRTTPATNSTSGNIDLNCPARAGRMLRIGRRIIDSGRPVGR
jgi:hypothetical protein